METRTCQNCKQAFAILPEDQAFYAKMQVPPPTHCAACRMQRRMAFRNERNLYQDGCGLCHKQTISMYAPGKPFQVFCTPCWWSDRWDPMSFGRPYDPARPFFIQFRELMEAVPRMSLATAHTVNSDYCNYVADAKDSYLCFGSIEIERCLYGSPYQSRDCVDTFLARECELCY